MEPLNKDEGIRRVNALIKEKLDTLERAYDWSSLEPNLVNDIRHTVIRIAFGSYKIGLIINR
jgi:hypothetical protein